MLAAEHQPFVSVLPASQGLPGEPCVAAANRPAVSGAALLWVTTDDGMAQEPGLPGQPETGPASAGNHGAPGHLPVSQDEPTSSWPPSISVSATGCSDYPAQPGLERRHYLHPHGSRLLVSGGHHGLVQPVCALLAVVQHPGGGLLY
jgi:hypothetical protein